MNENHVMHKFVDWLSDNEGCDEDERIDPYYRYSGRSMYNETCFGLVGRLNDILIALFSFLGDYPEEAAEMANAVKSLRTDSLGRREIVYFPYIQIDDPRSPKR